MKIKTKYHGEIQYDEEDIFTFSKGLPGFTELKKFILRPLAENEYFSILHSIEDEEIGFIVISPFDFIEDYEFQLEETTIKDLAINEPKNVRVINTVTLADTMDKITTNLVAPIIINIENNLGEQIILNDGKYLIKHPLFKR